MEGFQQVQLNTESLNVILFATQKSQNHQEAGTNLIQYQVVGNNLREMSLESSIKEEGESRINESEESTLSEGTTCMEFDKEIFIGEVRQYRCLWDLMSPTYKDRQVKQNAWNELAAKFGKDG